MSLGTTLSLSPDVPTGVDTNAIVSALRFADNGKGEYSVAGLTLPEKDILTVSHETTKDSVERHLVRIDKTVIDAELVPATVSVYMVIVVPPSTAATAAVVTAMVNRLADFFIDDTNGNVAKVLNGEV